MYQEVLLAGRRGVLLRALSAVDIALWDLLAKKARLPLAVLLGGRTGLVPAYASGVYAVGASSPADEVSAEVHENVANGFRDHKIKVGGLNVQEDAKRVVAAIAAMNGEGRLALDANNAYGSFQRSGRSPPCLRVGCRRPFYLLVRGASLSR